MNVSRPFELEGRVAIVTGGSRGIGAACARVLAKAGANVAITYVQRQDRAQSVVEEIRSLGRESIAVRAEAGSEDDMNRVVDETLGAFGTVDILVNNAVRLFPIKPILETAWDEVQSSIDGTIKGPFLLAKRVVPIMKDKKWGRIVNINTGIVVRPLAGYATYVIAKMGQLGLTRILALETGSYGVTVNTILPGLIWTEIHDALPAHTPERLQSSFEKQFIGRKGTAEDIAYGVLYFCSEQASFVSNVVMPIDGHIPQSSV